LATGPGCNGIPEYSIVFSMSADKMSAYLQVIEADDKMKYTVEELRQLLNAHGVVFGICPDVLEELSGNPRAFGSSVVMAAQGRLPQHGKTARSGY
jgi:hypothetical protein